MAESIKLGSDLLNRVTQFGTKGKVPPRPAAKPSAPPAALPLPRTGAKVPLDQAKLAKEAALANTLDAESIEDAAKSATKEMFQDAETEAARRRANVKRGKPDIVDFETLTPEDQARIAAAAANYGGGDGEELAGEDDDEGIINDLPAPGASPPPADAKPEFRSETGAATPAHDMFCPSCGWDQSMRDGVEIIPQDIDEYCEARELLVNYSKEYSLFEGRILIRLRELSPGELDACWQQTMYAVKTGQASSSGDMAEFVNRYRLGLQLVSARSVRAGVLDFEAPDGLSKTASPDAGSFWEFPDGELPEGSVGLDKVSEYVYGKVLKTESLVRSVQGALRDFNRFLVKMEAMSRNKGFFPKIASQDSFA